MSYGNVILTKRDRARELLRLPSKLVCLCLQTDESNYNIMLQVSHNVFLMKLLDMAQ